MQEMRVRFLGQENPPEEAMATHSNILAWVILWQRRLVGSSPKGGRESEATEHELVWLHRVLVTAREI